MLDLHKETMKTSFLGDFSKLNENNHLRAINALETNNRN